MKVYPYLSGAIAKVIEALRAERGMTKSSLADFACLERRYLRDIELGNKNPTIEILSYICEALNISLREFFDEQTNGQFCDDPLIAKVYRLTPKQREALLVFLDSILE